MLQALFGSPQRERLTRFLIEHVDTSFSPAELARALNASQRGLEKDARLLVEAGVLHEADGRYTLFRSFPLFAELQSIILRTAAMLQGDCIQELKQMPNLGLIVLTGRFVMRADAPIDVLLVGSVNRPKLDAAMRRLEKQGVSINYTVLSRSAFQSRWGMTDRFLYSIFEGKHEVLLDKWGLVSVPIDSN